MRIPGVIRGRIASAVARVALVAGGVLVGWLLFAGPAQAAPPEGEGPSADSGGLLGLVPVLEEPDRAVPAAEAEEPVEPVADLVEQITEPVEQVAEPVERVTESVEQVAEPVTQLVDQTTKAVVDPVTEVLADAPVVASLVDPVVASTVDPLRGAVEPVEAAASPLVDDVPDPLGAIVESGSTDAGLPVPLSTAAPAGPVTAAEPPLTLSAATVDQTSMVGPSQPPLARAGPPPAWWPGSAPEHAHRPGALAPPTSTGPAPARFPHRPLPGPVPGSGTYQLAGSPTDPGQPLAWAGPATVEPSADPVRLHISGDVVGSGLALPISPPPG
jgi:hypothetical protein